MKSFTLDPRTIESTCRSLSALNLHPDVIIDVGVATGTPWLYKQFKDATYHLVEPNPFFSQSIEGHLSRMAPGSKWHSCAAGNCEFTATLSYPEHAKPGGATISENKSDLASSPDNNIQVSVKRIDSLVKSSLSSGERVLLKTDCQGYDARAIYGSEGIMNSIDCIITEVSLISAVEPVLELFSYLMNKGFSLFDIADPLTSSRKQRLAQFDACFVKSSLL